MGETIGALGEVGTEPMKENSTAFVNGRRVLCL